MTAPPPTTGTTQLRGILIAGICLVAIGGAVGYWAARSRSPDDDQQPTPEKKQPEQTVGPPWFTDMTSGSGLDFTYRNGEEAKQYTILESLGGGVGLLDYDGDGRLDIFVTGGGLIGGSSGKEFLGQPCRLYRNLGDWKFEDVTDRVGLSAVKWWYTHGVAVADYDRDGWPDFIVTGYGRIALFHNEPDPRGGRKFVDVSASVGLKDDSWSTSAGWADIDGDGFPDLYVCHYCDWSWSNNPTCTGQRPGVVRDVCPPQKFKPLVHALFKNDGGKRFRDVSAEHGFKANGCGLGVVLADVNDDRRPDIYVGNDATFNFLLMNRGGRLEEKALLAGVAGDDTGTYDGSMGVDVGEFDGTGRAAIWVTNFQAELHALYQNLGKETFQHRSRSAGIGAIGQHFVGFGTAFVDADQDGWDDLVIANGHVLQQPGQGSPHAQLPVLLKNGEFEGRRFFRDLGATAGPYFRTPVVGRGLAVGDLDNDGWPDLAISHTNSPVALLRNVVKEHAPAKWVGFRLIGRGNRDIVGSTVQLETDSRTLTKFIKGGGSYLSASDQRILFGLGSAGQAKRVTIKWSWGNAETWQVPEAGSYWEVREGTQQLKRSSPAK